MSRKVLGIMLFFALLPFLIGCNASSDSTSTMSVLSPGEIAFELYDTDGNLVSRKVVTYDEQDTLLGLLQENYTVYCQGEDGNPDDTCSFAGEYGYYIVGIDDLTAFSGNFYIAFYVDGSYAVSGIGETDITDQTTYQFKLKSF